jgi:hypothetical protein
MIYAFYGTLAGIAALLAAATWAGINTPEPAGAHHKPRAPREWPWRERVAFRANARIARRQRERDRDEATERLFSGMQVPPEIARDATPDGILRYDGPGLTPGQLREFGRSLNAVQHMPLPPDCPHCGGTGCEACDAQCLPAEPEDPAEVVTPEDEADAYVGDLPEPGSVQDESAPGDFPAPGNEPEPEFDHLRAGQYAEAGAVPTGFFAAALLDDYEAEQLLASYRERAEAEVSQ